MSAKPTHRWTNSLTDPLRHTQRLWGLPCSGLEPLRFLLFTRREETLWTCPLVSDCLLWLLDASPSVFECEWGGGGRGGKRGLRRTGCGRSNGRGLRKVSLRRHSLWCKENTCQIQEVKGRLLLCGDTTLTTAVSGRRIVKCVVLQQLYCLSALHLTTVIWGQGSLTKTHCSKKHKPVDLHHPPFLWRL